MESGKDDVLKELEDLVETNAQSSESQSIEICDSEEAENLEESVEEPIAEKIEQVPSAPDIEEDIKPQVPKEVPSVHTMLLYDKTLRKTDETYAVLRK